MSKEKPILFNADMVRAILDGRKTQTRRICKSDVEFDSNGEPSIFVPENRNDDLTFGKWVDAYEHCPFGSVGDELYVRETFRIVNMDKSSYHPNESQQDDYEPCNVLVGYRAYDGVLYANDLDFKAEEQAIRFFNKTNWSPSLHMPRWASRIQLKITDIRVERVADISVEDALSEGINHNTMNYPPSEFAWLWNSINTAPGKTWADNPWVWIVEFERIK